MFTKHTNILFFICIVIAVSTSYSQDKIIDQGLKTIKIDLDSGTVIDEFPFDENINLEITSKKNKLIDSVAYFEVVYVEGKTILDNSRLRRYARKISKTRDSTISNAKFIPIPLEDGDIKYLKVKTSGLSPYTYRGLLKPLNPDKIYQFLLTKRLNKKQLDTVYKILRLVKNDSASVAEKLFLKELKSLDDNSFYLLTPETMSSFEFLEDSLLPKIKKIYSEFSSLKKQPQEVSPNDIESYMTMLGSKKISDIEFSETMFGFTSIGGENNLNVYLGLRAIGSDTIANLEDYGLRAENIKASNKKLKKLDKQFRKLITHKATDINLAKFYEENILEMKHSLQYNDSLVSAITKKANDTINTYYSFSDVVTNSTIGKQDKKTGLAYLVADIGFVSALGKDQANETEYIGRPYLGLNWHISGYNKDKKVSQLAQKRFWARFSLSFGVTIGKIDEGGYEDLFESVSPTLGLNTRLAKNVRVGTGVLLLRYNRNPIVSKESLAPLPYLSISFDSNFFKEFALFNTIFGK
ncbi:MAG: hypothetical protein ACSHW7_02285 [Patiriisocius sp.]|uniref:hypothetical protein n=1 Tax=Patiriisocius sp. TaxID=2822396 RepID=UPI003EF41B58